jgi:hypothetical protein
LKNPDTKAIAIEEIGNGRGAAQYIEKDVKPRCFIAGLTLPPGRRIAMRARLSPAEKEQPKRKWRLLKRQGYGSSGILPS